MRPFLKEMNALNVYQINIIQNLKFIHKTKYGRNPQFFTSVRQDFPKTASIIKNLLVKPPALQLEIFNYMFTQLGLNTLIILVLSSS